MSELEKLIFEVEAEKLHWLLRTNGEENNTSGKYFVHIYNKEYLVSSFTSGETSKSYGATKEDAFKMAWAHHQRYKHQRSKLVPVA
jgi:hypothetical protein